MAIPLSWMAEAAAQGDLFISYSSMPADSIVGFDLVILEPDHYSPSQMLRIKENNNRVLGYLSLTEVHPSSPHFDSMKPYLMGKNPDWEGYYLNISKPEVRQMLWTRAHNIMEKGFDGLFLDTLDNAGPWGPIHSFGDELIELIQRLARHTRRPYLIQNGALWAMDELAPFVHGVIIESTLSCYDFEERTYKLRTRKDRQKRLQTIQSIRNQYGITVYAVEYTDRRADRDRILEMMPEGIPTFIGNIELNGRPKFH